LEHFVFEKNLVNLKALLDILQIQAEAQQEEMRVRQLEMRQYLQKN
jgi:hypothetical protein